MKTEIQTVILLFVSIWTTVSLLFGWLLLRSNKQCRKAQQIKYPEA
jgi:hypothetical protein